MKEDIRIYIPTGESEHLEVLAEHIPESCTIKYNNFTFDDGHREGTISLPNGERYSIDRF